MSSVTNKVQELSYLFISYLMINYVIPYLAQKTFNIVFQTRFWNQKDFSNITEELDECSDMLKEKYNNFNKFLKDNEENEQRWFFNRWLYKIKKSFKERQILYFIQRRNNLNKTEKTLRNINAVNDIEQQ